MKCKIEKVWTLISPDGIAYRRFRLRFAKKIFFINEIDFRNHTELIMILDVQIILKEPVDQNFNFDKIQDKEKTLVIIKPKSEKFNDDPSVPASELIEKSGKKEITRDTPVNISKLKEALKNSKRDLSEHNEENITTVGKKIVFEVLDNDIPAKPEQKEAPVQFSRNLNADKVNATKIGKIPGFEEAIAAQKKEETVAENYVSDAEGFMDLTEPDFSKVIASGNASNNPFSKRMPNLNDFLKATNENKAAQKTDDSNIAFFKEMILLASNEKVDSSSKNRLFNLIGTELQKTKSAEITILEKIQDDLTNLIKGKTPAEPPTAKPKPSHAPRATFNFLRGFRFPAESPFKFLTHSQANETDELGNIIPINHDEIAKILNEAKNHPALIRDFRNQKAVNFEPIHNDIREKAKDLINSFEEVLISPENSPDHPYETSAEYRRKCENFKQNFRIGNSERETKLRSLILSAAQTKLHRIRPNITFHNGVDDFDRHAVFFSWKPALDNTFQYIFSEIESNSNINGSREFEAEKRITIKLNDEPMQDDIIHLDIIDHESICPDDPDQLLAKLRSSKPTQLNNLWGLCNWSIIADFTSGPFKVHIISDNHNEYEVARSVRLENPVGAFKHRITFYKP